MANTLLVFLFPLGQNGKYLMSIEPDIIDHFCEIKGFFCWEGERSSIYFMRKLRKERRSLLERSADFQCYKSPPSKAFLPSSPAEG